MNKLLRLASLALICLALVGCYENFSPIKSASYTSWQAGKPLGDTQQLTPEQITKLSEWLQNHKWGWDPVSGTFLPATQLSLSHTDGSSSSANLMKNTLTVGKNQRGLSESESQELHSIIGVQYGS